jgi:hypothetical protein
VKESCPCFSDPETDPEWSGVSIVGVSFETSAFLRVLRTLGTPSDVGAPSESPDSTLSESTWALGLRVRLAALAGAVETSEMPEETLPTSATGTMAPPRSFAVSKVASEVLRGRLAADFATVFGERFEGFSTVDSDMAKESRCGKKRRGQSCRGECVVKRREALRGVCEPEAGTGSDVKLIECLETG